MKKKFKLGFMVGRFQMLHKGHESLINEGLELCERFVLLLGNSEDSRTKNNPFTFEERKEMIKTVRNPDQTHLYMNWRMQKAESHLSLVNQGCL